MKDYLIVIATTLVLAWMIERTQFGPVNSLGNRNKDRLCYFMIYAVLTLFIGLRTYYNDTFVYFTLYNKAATFPDFWEDFTFQLGDNPGFMIVQSWLKTKQVPAQTYILLFAALSMLCTLLFVKHYSSNVVLSLFLFFATNAYTLSAAALKQSAAIAIGLIAIIFAQKRKWGWFAVFLFLATTFHPYVLVFAIVPILTFKPWTGKTYIMLAVFLVVGFALESLLGTIVDITSMIGDSYKEEDLIGEGINVFRVLVFNVPLVLSFLYRKRLFEDSSRAENLIVNLAMINGAIMFVGSFGTAIYFSRMASFFTIAQCIVLPWILEKLPRRERTFYTWGMLAGYSGFFIYANMINQSFDANFSRITLAQYLAEYVFK